MNYDFNLRNIVFACNGKTPADRIISVIELDEKNENQQYDPSLIDDFEENDPGLTLR